MRLVSFLGFAELEHAELVAHKARRRAMGIPPRGITRTAARQNLPGGGHIRHPVGIVAPGETIESKG
jgi:hypothetical protein